MNMNYRVLLLCAPFLLVLPTELPAQGDPDESARREETGAEGSFELFSGGYSWVSSITTVAAPHEGWCDILYRLPEAE